MATRYQHREAFNLIVYVSKSGEKKEAIWNSRDGVTPYIVRDPETGKPLQADEYQFAPWYVPAIGSRVFVDLTEQRARVLASQRIERMESRRDVPIPLHQLFATREAAVEDAFRSIYRPGAPDILVVTAGWLEQLAVQRAQMFPGPTDGGEIAPVSAPEEDESESGECSLYYDRQGKPISAGRYVTLFSNAGYKRVKLTQITPTIYVSTVWLGADHGAFSEKPIIFETMTFEENELKKGSTSPRFPPELDHDDPRLFDRYSTEAEALAGHDRRRSGA